MTTAKTLLLAAAVGFFLPVGSAFAHSDDNGYYNRHARDDARHWQFHDRVNREHERAHEEGFYSRGEHRAYHRALRDRHGEFHEDHPGTRHDHYSWRRYY